MTTSSLRRMLSRMQEIYRTNGASGLWHKLSDRVSPAGRAFRRRKEHDDAGFDAAGYDTSGIQRIYGMDIVGEAAASGGNHIAVPTDEFAATMAALDMPPDGATFIDLGSGKGRAVLLAAELPFAAVIGVEFARELHEVAEANLRRRAERRGPDGRIRLLHEDATRFSCLAGPIVLFVYNAFDPPVLTAVARNAFASWRADPRPFRVIYLNPVHRAEWTDAGFRELTDGPGFVIYAPNNSG